MRSILRSLLMLAYLSGAASAQSAVSVAREAEDVKATLVQMWSAVESADVSRYASFVHPDFAQFGETDSYLSEGKASARPPRSAPPRGRRATGGRCRDVLRF